MGKFDNVIVALEDEKSRFNLQVDAVIAGLKGLAGEISEIQVGAPQLTGRRGGGPNSGRRWSPATRAKMAAGMKKYWAKRRQG